MDESKHEIHSQVDAITAGTASVVNLTAGQWHWHDYISSFIVQQGYIVQYVIACKHLLEFNEGILGIVNEASESVKTCAHSFTSEF